MTEKLDINNNKAVSTSVQASTTTEVENSTSAENVQQAEANHEEEASMLTENGEQAEAKATDEEEPSTTAVKVEQTEQTKESTSIFSDIKKSKEWRILAYSANQEHRDHHMSLLSGIIGKEIPPEDQEEASYQLKKNGVTVTVHFGEHPDCKVTYEDVDLLLFFTWVNSSRRIIERSSITQIEQISKSRGTMIWKHSIAILTGVDAIVDSFGRRSSEASTRQEMLLEACKAQIQEALEQALGNQINPTDVLIVPTGRQDQPDLPKPHEKWFTQLWHGCCFSSNKSQAAILKIAQDRISYDVRNNSLKDLHFHKQPIKVDKKGLSYRIRVGLGLGGGGAAAAGTVGGAAAAGTVGATVGALTGALAIGIPSFGVAAGTGLVLGAVLGGGAGVGVAGAAGGGRKLKQIMQGESSQKIDYEEILINLPQVAKSLKASARSQVACRIIVTGVRGEGTSTVAAALTGKQTIKRAESYWLQVRPMIANLVTFDLQGFPRVGDEQSIIKKYISLQYWKDTHLLVFCIPMNNKEDEFVYTPHAEALKCLSKADANIFNNIAIALTHANEMPPQDYDNEYERWKSEIRKVLKKQIYLDEETAKKIPIIPVGNEQPTIDLSDGRKYHWLSEFFLKIIPFTKAGGVPSLVALNKKRIKKQPEEYQDLEEAKKQIIEAQCNMFTKMGLKDWKPFQGEAIGLILGENELDW